MSFVHFLFLWESCLKCHLMQAGVMQTHDEETKKFFRRSSVICVLSPRYASSKLGYMKQKVDLCTLFFPLFVRSIHVELIM